MLSYSNKAIRVNLKEDKNLSAGCAILSQAGEDIMSLCSLTMDQEFFDYLMMSWTNEGLNPQEVAAGLASVYRQILGCRSRRSDAHWAEHYSRLWTVGPNDRTV